MAKRATRTRATADIRERIVDTAIAMAEESRWARVRLRTVAEHLDIPPAEVFDHFRDLDAVADAWFGRALRAMLGPPPEGFAEWPAADRLHFLLMRWFDALAAHRTVTSQMLGEKLYPSHPHHWVPMVFSLSRLVQWWRDAAGLDAGGPRRQVEESGLTAIFLVTLSVWRRDDSPEQERTRTFLRNRLSVADRAMAALWRREPLPDTGEGTAVDRHLDPGDECRLI